MFTILKRRLKHRIARLIYNFMKAWYDVDHWTRSISCHYCAQLITSDGRFCPYCGHLLRIAPPLTDFSNPTAARQRLEMEPVTIMLPEDLTRRYFINYVRTHRQQAGPATHAHRSFQDQEPLS